jgi:hypothetical protein
MAGARGLGSRSYGARHERRIVSLCKKPSSTNERLPRFPCLLYVTPSASELAEQELLGKVCANAFRDADCEVSEYQPDTAI